MRRIAIIGAGAAGLAAAVAAGRAHAHVRIALFEASDRIGRSILASGNGRCNFSNAYIDAAQYHNAAFVAESLEAFEDLMAQRGEKAVAAPPVPAAPCAPNGVARFFEQLGMLWREEGEGRLYPQANKASVVLDVLRAAVTDAGVEVRTEAPVERICPPREAGGAFAVQLADGRCEQADAVIVACGGSVAHGLLGDALEFIPQRPVLGPMATDTRLIKQLDNIRVKCAVELRRKAADASMDGGADRKGALRETGEVLFRKYGISGIAAFNISRWAQPGDVISLDLFPGMSSETLSAAFSQRLIMLKASFREEITYADFLRGAVLPQVARVLLAYANLSEHEPCTEEAAVRLARVCKGFDLAYKGIGDAAQCQVRRGGFAVGGEGGFDARTLQALRLPGLFVVGEALDVDGPCGGYNLHWAFASGILAGTSAVGSCG